MKEQKKELKELKNGNYVLHIKNKGTIDEEPVSQEIKVEYTKNQVKDFYKNLVSMQKNIRDSLAKERKKLEDLGDIDFDEVEHFRKIQSQVEALNKKEETEKTIEDMEKKLSDTKKEISIIERQIPETKRNK